MVNSKIIAGGILRAVAALIGIGFLLYFLYAIQTVLLYLVIALILSLIGRPIQRFFKTKLKFKQTSSSAMVIVFYLLLIVGFLSMFVPLIASQGENLSLLNTATIEKNTLELIEQLSVWLESHHIDAQAIFKNQKIASKFDFDFIPDLLNALVGAISGFGVGLVSVLFITFFFLNDRQSLITGAKLLIPDSHEEQILNSIEKINELLSRYFIGLLIQLFIVFVLYLIVLLIFGVDNALVIAFLCGLLNIVPYIGPLIASVMAAVLTMLGNLGQDFQTEILPTTLYVMIGFAVVQMIDNNVSQPLIFSKSVSSHPLEIFLVILSAGFLFGIAGMIIAVPLYTILKVIGKEFFPDNSFIQFLTKNI
ncbi:AI-2E family transporter [Flavobacterium sp. CYK-55]|uniref:AI-2E family transporter n=1 Tax=Flavobacterium sp. CYK-55 TaxID=2835529 RepID=UPI001BCDA4C1|nr:AI-2E family transporter [Flavobacterium sp. CYK-55]MBS7786796.1 AI-2E family transporter [Flavobacterium sp. CYK-55]